MMNRDRICVWRETLPLLHVSTDITKQYTCVRTCTVHTHLLQILKCHVYKLNAHIQSENSFAGPPKVENVTFGRTRVQDNKIWQDVSWSTVQLQNNELQTKYIIKQVSAPVASQEMATTTRSKMNSSTLKLQVPTSNTTLTVWVAATLNTSSYRGDFSDPHSITYTSMFSDHHTGTAMALTLVCHTPRPPSFITAPGSPEDLVVVNRTCHSITFQWSPPDDTGRLDITGYDILHNGASVANISGTEYTLKGLTPDTLQTIRVRSRNAIGPSVLERTLTSATERRGENKSSTYALNEVDMYIVCMMKYKVN